MPLTTAGAQFLAKAWTGLNGPAIFDLSRFHLGVGNNATAFNVSQTDLQAAVGGGQFFRKPLSAGGSLTESNGVVTATATFGTTEANFDWVEWGCFNALTGGTMQGRKVESPSLGVKSSTQVWTLQATITWSA